MGIGEIADDIARLFEDAQEGVSELFETTVRLGVTGLSRSGKTVFITSLAANLLDRGRMAGLEAEAEGRVLAARLRPQPDRDVPRFDFEGHLGALLAPAPRWPDSTRRISQLRVSLRLAPSGLLSPLRGPRTVHLDIVDYPGEWLLDLALMPLSYDAWRRRALEEARRPARAPHAQKWLGLAEGVAADADFDEATARALSRAFTDYLAACRAAGLSGLAPGRFLMPGDLEGSPALAFAPLAHEGSGPLAREMRKRFDAYKRAVVKPFFRDHFSRIDRQVVLVDLLSAINAGPAAVADLRDAMTRVLEAFRPGENSWLAPLLGRRVERILFAATKADHIHHSQHDRLAAILRAMLRQSADRADFRGARTRAMAVASLRATTETEAERGGRKVPLVRGRLMDGREAALHPGDLPEDPAAILEPARAGETRWLDDDYAVMDFAPPRLRLKPGDGPPHIRLDRAAQFLFGDKLT